MRTEPLHFAGDTLQVARVRCPSGLPLFERVSHTLSRRLSLGKEKDDFNTETP